MVKDQVIKYNYAVIVASGAAVALLLAGIFIVKPLLETVGKMDKEKQAKSATLAEMKKRESVLLGLKDQEDQLTKDSETITNALPTQADIGRLFIQLDTLAKDSGGTLKSVSQTNTQAPAKSTFSGVAENTYSIPVEMPTYFALKQFIANSKDALRLLSIENLKISSTEAGQLSVSITAKSYARTK